MAIEFPTPPTIIDPARPDNNYEDTNDPPQNWRWNGDIKYVP